MITPVTKTGVAFYFLAALLAVTLAWFIYSAMSQIIQGHQLSGLSTHAGAAWGLLPANIVFLIGVSHVGIGVSAATRLLSLSYLKPYTRIAEMLTIVCLPAAVVAIAMDVGRPEVFIFNVMRWGRINSPFVWSATVISVYFSGSMVYLYLSLRRDIANMAHLVPKRAGLYRFLSLGYKDTEDENQRHERVLWWLALIIVPIMVSVHSVYGLIFGLQGSRPGWYNPFQAPYFVLGAIVSGFATLILVAALLRWLFRWQEFLKPVAIRNLGRFLSWMTLFYIYFLIAEILTMSYNAPAAEKTISYVLLRGNFAPIFWPAMVLLVSGYFMLFFNQTVFRHRFSIGITTLGALLINISLYITRYLIVVPSGLNPLLPYPKGSYSPTLVEWSIVLGTFAFAIAVYIAFLKLFPIVELHHSEK